MEFEMPPALVCARPGVPARAQPAEATAARGCSSRPVPTACAGAAPAVLTELGEGLSGLSGRNGNKIGVSITFRQPRQATRVPAVPVLPRDDRFREDLAKRSRARRRKFRSPRPSTPRACLDRPNWVFLLRDLTFDRSGNPVILYDIRHQKRAPAPPRLPHLDHVALDGPRVGIDRLF